MHLHLAILIIFVEIFMVGKEIC